MDNLLLRKIPKIDVLLSSPILEKLCGKYPYALVKDAAQTFISEIRRDVISGRVKSVPSAAQAAEEIASRLEAGDIYSLKRVINATGIVLHTNLGRAPLGKAAAARIAEIAEGYSNLEYDIDLGSRGSRYAHIEKLLCAVTGAEAAFVVNNNAGAVFLMLNTFASGKKVAVSRGELVEIGGSFRIPEIMARSGAELMEVGTTNKTHPADYEEALDAGAEVLLKVHASNFRITGFTESVDIQTLAAMARARDALTIYDMGSGLLFPGESLGLMQGEYPAGKAMRDGADLISFSADKLMGSAQAGIIVGKKELIEKLKKNHLARMLRIDKLSLAALEYTLKNSVSPDLAAENIPTLKMLTRSESQCLDDAHTLEKAIRASTLRVETQVLLIDDEAGGGSLPGVTFPGAAVAVSVEGMEAAELEEKLRRRRVPVIARIHRQAVLLSVRTLSAGDHEEIAAALSEIALKGGGQGK